MERRSEGKCVWGLKFIHTHAGQTKFSSERESRLVSIIFYIILFRDSVNSRGVHKLVENIEVCPICGQLRWENSKFCIACGHNFINEDPNFSSSTVDRVKNSLSITKDVALSSANIAKEKAVSLVSKEKASEAVQSMVEVVTYVAQDLKMGMSSEMVKAVTVSARISFVAFSVGVSIALDKVPLRTKKKAKKVNN